MLRFLSVALFFMVKLRHLSVHGMKVDDRCSSLHCSWKRWRVLVLYLSCLSLSGPVCTTVFPHLNMNIRTEEVGLNSLRLAT